VAGTLASLENIDVAVLREHLRANYGPRQTVLALAGDVEHGAARDLVEERLAGWRDRGSGADPGATPVPPPGIQSRADIRPTEQCHIVVGARSTSYRSPDRFTADVL